MRHLIRRTNVINPRLQLILNSAATGSSHIYQTRMLSNRTEKEDLVQYTKIKDISEEGFNDWVSGLSRKMKPYPRGMALDLNKSDVVQVDVEDVVTNPQDNFGQIVVASQDAVKVHYAEKGIAPSESKSPKDLLIHTLEIEPKTMGVLDIAKHVPFVIEAKDPENTIALASCQLSIVPSHEENINRYSMSNVIEMPHETAKIIALRLQQAIFEDKKNEYFYEEVTSRVYPPTKYNKSSGTLMSFEIENGEEEKNKTTATHYHPGERSLYIFTTNKTAGATLNFCGVEENPDQRTDCEVKLKFQKNSLVILNFPPYTHHKFHGEFVCISIHPREGINLIEAVQSGTLPKGFLESATVFSKTIGDKEEDWKLSLPTENSEQDKSTGLYK